jgi:hypothetical protein
MALPREPLQLYGAARVTERYLVPRAREDRPPTQVR